MLDCLQESLSQGQPAHMFSKVEKESYFRVRYGVLQAAHCKQSASLDICSSLPAATRFAPLRIFNECLRRMNDSHPYSEKELRFILLIVLINALLLPQISSH